MFAGMGDFEMSLIIDFLSNVIIGYFIIPDESLMSLSFFSWCALSAVTHVIGTFFQPSVVFEKMFRSVSIQLYKAKSIDSKVDGLYCISSCIIF